MRLNWFISILAGAVLITGCSKKSADTQASATSASATSEKDGDLLMRVQFAGTAAAMADTNFAYLTNIAALPETAALRSRIVGRMAELVGRLVTSQSPPHLTLPSPLPEGAERENTSGARSAERGMGTVSPTNTPATNLQPATFNLQPAEDLAPVLDEMLTRGFALELRGASNGVKSLALTANATTDIAARWDAALGKAAHNWFAGAPETTNASGWSAGSRRVVFTHGEGWAGLAVSDSTNGSFKTISGELAQLASRGLQAKGGTNSPVMEVELASSLLPGPIQRSVYGSFTQLHLSVYPGDECLRIRGRASYTADLPRLSSSITVPTNLFTDTLISFTVVQNPDGWLEKNSAIRGLMPAPLPDSAFFWGGDMAPYQFFTALPFTGDTNYLPMMAAKINAFAAIDNNGNAVVDATNRTLNWSGVPFAGPSLRIENSAGSDFLIGATFPTSRAVEGLDANFVRIVGSRTNLLLYDWEFTASRLDSWFRVGQLALLMAQYKQLAGDTASLKWLQAAAPKLPNGGNTVTEITQTGPRELALSRRAPLLFTSAELFWLANWLESSNFPAANFLVPVPTPGQ